MKKTITAIFSLLCVSFILHAQNVPIVSNTGISTFSMLNDDPSTLLIKVEVGQVTFEEVETSEGTALIPHLSESTPILKQGFPDVPKLTASVIIPDNGYTDIQMVDGTFTEYENVMIAPSKGNLYRNQNPSTIPFEFGQIYNENTLYPSTESEGRAPYILRDYRGQTVVCNPIQYNPVTKVLRVYDEMTIRVRVLGDAGINELDRAATPTKVTKEYEHTYSNHFLNFNSQSGTRYDPISDQGNLLIVCHDNYMSEMAPYIAWKKQKGIPTEMVAFSSIGTTAAQLQSYVANYYNNTGLAFLLIVGDHGDVPALNSNYGYSDNAFGYISGGDYYPEIIVGRFSAENTEHVATMVDRTIRYEKFPTVDNGNGGAGWYARAMGIGSQEGAGIGDDDEIDYEHLRNIADDLLNFTYTYAAEMFEGSQGGNDAPGYPTSTMVIDEVNDGLSFVNYTGHGSQGSCGTSGFSSAEADQLQNVDEYPFWVSVACQNGVFMTGTCIAEAMTRSSHNGQPAGSIGFYGATINQSWAPPMAGQDEITDILVRSYQNNIQRSIGGMGVNGIMQSIDDYAGGGAEIMDTWVLFGDPTAYMRTANPEALSVSHVGTTPLGTSQLTVTSPNEGAYVALTLNGEIIGTGYVSGGSVNISFDALTTLDPVTVTVTDFNCFPYFGDVAVSSDNEPYVAENGHLVDDQSGNNNQALEFGESALLDVTLENIGLEMAYGVQAILSTTDPYINITDNTHTWGNLAEGASLLQDDAYAITVADDVPDQHVASFTLSITDTDGNSWSNTFSLTINAPEFSCGNISIDDSDGNNNGQLDDGETVTIEITTTNDGHANSPQVNATLASGSSYLTIDNASVTTTGVGTGATATFSFTATVSQSVPAGSDVTLSYALAAGEYGVSCSFDEPFNIIVEDFESNDHDQFDWEMMGNADWFTTTSDPYEGDYCSESGDIDDNQSTTLEIAIDVASNDEISFAKRVSSEADWDFLQFYIDGAMQDEWSGEIAWSENVYNVSAGMHTFTWTYYKDGSVSEGADAAWVDEIVLPAPVDTTSNISVEDMLNDPSLFNIYPNPTNGLVNVLFTAKNETNVSLDVLNPMGQVIRTIRSGSVSQGRYINQVDLSQLATGVYSVRLQAGDRVITKRLSLLK